MACIPCKDKKTRCSDFRPCARCSGSDLDKCVDSAKFQPVRSIFEADKAENLLFKTLTSSKDEGGSEEWLWEAAAGPGKEDPFQDDWKHSQLLWRRRHRGCCPL